MIAVIGAGPAGLAAAWRAALAGHEVVVFERAETVGGMAGSFEVAGMRVDHGSHRLHPSTGAHLLDALRELLGDDLQLRRRHGRLRLRDRWVAFPLETADLVRALPPRVAAAAAIDAVTAPLRRPRADTFAEVVRSGLGPTVYRELYEPYARKLWNADGGELAGELARRRVSASSPGDIVRRLARARQPNGRGFYYPRRGFGAITEALADAAVAAGADIRTQTSVSALEACADRGGDWTVLLADGSRVDVQHVWSTAPIAALAELVAPPAPPAIADAASRLQHRGVVLVYLVHDGAAWTEFDAHYLPSLDVLPARVSEPKNYRDSRDDPADRTVVCAEIACTPGDDVWSAEPGELAARVADDLARCGLPRLRVTGVDVRRLPRVYPVYRTGFEWDLSAVELWASSLAGLVVFGRQGLFVPDNTHHALAMGWAAAGALRADGTFDADAWLHARDGFRDFVVED